MKLKHHIDIQMDEPIADIAPQPLLKAANAALAYQKVDERCEMVIAISDDETLRALNLRFRGVDRPTDVLAFANETRGPFAGGGGRFPCYLGDIVISIDRAKAQSEAVQGALVQELQVLVVHGVLHLLGYDHAQPEDKARMWAAQNAILTYLDIDIPLPE